MYALAPIPVLPSLIFSVSCSSGSDEDSTGRKFSGLGKPSRMKPRKTKRKRKSRNPAHGADNSVLEVVGTSTGALSVLVAFDQSPQHIEQARAWVLPQPLPAAPATTPQILFRDEQTATDGRIPSRKQFSKQTVSV